MTIFAVALGKGGCGKTAFAAELCMNLPGSVLAVDLDRQGNLTTRLGVTGVNALEGVAADVVNGSLIPAEAAVPSPHRDGLHVLAGTDDLKSFDQHPERVGTLRDILRDEAGEWDHIVIDTPSHQGLITVSGLAAAEQVIAACACTGEAYIELAKLERHIEQNVSKSRLRKGQRIHHVVPTLYKTGKIVSEDILQRINARYADAATPPVRHAVAVEQAFTAAMPISVYEPRSAVAQDYRAAVAHITQEK